MTENAEERVYPEDTPESLEMTSDIIDDGENLAEKEVKIIPTGISPEYVKDWNVEMAIREVLQNYLDSKKEFNCDGSIIWKDGFAKVKDNGPGIELRHLAMGISEKDMDSIGKFGEGLKLAMLVLAREGRKIEVWSNSKIIKPVIAHSNDYQTEVMEFHVKDMLPRHAARFTGTGIKFLCEKEELNIGKEFFIDLLPKNSSFSWKVKDKLSTPGGLIFVNGAAVGTIQNATFSYHISGSEGVDLGNRDRSSISQDDINPKAAKILAKCRKTNVMKLILKDLIIGKDSYETQVGISIWSLDDTDKKIWKRAVTETFGKNTLVTSESTEMDREAEYRGFNVIRAGYRWNLILKGVGMDTVQNRIKAKKKGVKVILRKDLIDEERNNLNKAIRLVTKHYEAPGSIKIAEDLKEKAGVADDFKPFGLWVPTEQMIYISRHILDDLDQTLHAILHETVHKKTGKKDCTSEFEQALTDVAVKMMLR